MNSIGEAELQELLAVEQQPCISFYMPTVQSTAETRQNPTRLKNLLRQAEQELIAWGIRSPEARALLRPARERQRDRAFWQHQSSGLAIFLAQNFQRELRLPFAVDELVSVSDRFHLKPLLEYSRRNGRFYVLALDLEQIRLFRSNQFEIEEIPIEDVPTAVEEGLRFDDPEAQLQFHTSTDSPGGRRPAQFFGQGVGVNDVKDDLLRYFHKVDRKLQPYLPDKELPMVMVGIGYSLPIYREANSYAHLLEKGIDRNPERMDPDTLRELAWELIDEQLQAEREHAVQAYGHLIPRQRALSDLKQVVTAAHDGAIESLFLARGEQVWGSFDPEARHVEAHSERQPGDRDLLDLAAVQVWKHAGDVYLMDRQDVPGQGPVAANARIPLQSG